MWVRRGKIQSCKLILPGKQLDDSDDIVDNSTKWARDH